MDFGILSSGPINALEWELRAAAEGEPCGRIVLGPKSSTTGKIDERAVFTWSAQDRRFDGPMGGVNQRFLRVEGPAGEDLKRFALYRSGR